MSKNKEGFSSSRELRIFFNEQFEIWKDRTSGNLKQLAGLCGVSPSYLSQVSRYGRIPGRPVLILLAFNFRLPDPQKIFDIAEIRDDWPYDKRIGLVPDSRKEESFVSVRVDLPGLTDSIRSIIKQELKPIGAVDLLSQGPIRIGINPMQPWMLESKDPSSSENGIFQEICKEMGISLQQQVIFKSVPFALYQKKLQTSEIDLYGPIMALPTNPAGISYSRPLLRTSIVGVSRLRETAELPSLPTPQKLSDLKTTGYKVAVLRGALPQMLLTSKLKLSPEQLVICDSDEEARDRIILKGIQSPAHIFICNSLFAETIIRDHPKDTKMVFADSPGEIDLEEVTIAVKPEWHPALPIINQALDFILNRAGYAQRLAELFSDKSSKLLTIMN